MLRCGFFRREVELALRGFGCALIVGAFSVTLAWGYHYRQQAQAWRDQACSYRLADVSRRATFLAGEDPADACSRLQSLGLGLRLYASPPALDDVARP
jgi:hypothetical protein